MKREIVVEIRGGNVVDVRDLPPGWDYVVQDWDNCPNCGQYPPYCPECEARYQGVQP